MASTGTAVFTMNRDALINAAYRRLRVLQEGATASATQITSAAETLNVVIKWLQSKGMLLWTYSTLSFPTVGSKTTYTIGPSGADVTANRPLAILEPCLLRLTQGGQNYDTPLTLLNRADYLRLGNKGGSGYPNSLYYDAQFNTATGATSASTGYGTLYAYVTPMDNTRTFILNVKRQLFDMTNATDEFDFPAECFKALIWTLAEELADEEEVPLQRIQYIQAKAKEARTEMLDSSVEAQPTQFRADATAYRRPRP